MASTSQTGTITNTFTAGNVKITMDEAKVDLYGVKVGNTRVSDKNEYKLIPGHKYTKDPTIYVDENSESCWLFVKVENGIAEIEGGTKIADQLVTNGWTALAGEDNVYYHAIADKNATVKVFESFTIKTDANVDAFKTAEIAVTAYAVQAEGFDTPDAAWDAAKFS